MTNVKSGFRNPYFRLTRYEASWCHFNQLQSLVCLLGSKFEYSLGKLRMRFVRLHTSWSEAAIWAKWPRRCLSDSSGVCSRAAALHSQTRRSGSHPSCCQCSFCFHLRVCSQYSASLCPQKPCCASTSCLLWGIRWSWQGSQADRLWGCTRLSSWFYPDQSVSCRCSCSCQTRPYSCCSELKKAWAAWFPPLKGYPGLESSRCEWLCRMALGTGAQHFPPSSQGSPAVWAMLKQLEYL